ncbi:MAG: hemolysin family protein [Fimbriimonadaceae bacterium]
MSDLGFAIVGLLIFASSFFFVAAEYALVSARESKIAPLAKKGSIQDKLALAAMGEQSKYVAGTQVCITFLSIALGAVIEPWLSEQIIGPLFPKSVPEFAVSFVSIVIVSYPLVVAGELLPKYLALQFPEQILRAFIVPLRIIVTILKPIIWFFEKSGQLLLKALRIPVDENAGISREEIHFMIKSGEESGGIHEDHADFITKALRLDELDAEDAMLHRLDIKWLDVTANREQVLDHLKHIPNSRIPVCEGDIDEIVGIAYLHDITIHLDDPDFDLRKIARSAVYVPESLTLNRLVEIMRETKTQIVIVQDEYGGTQGLVTLEDVIEEVFGDMEDRLESERPAIERTSPGRLSVRPDIRYDELIDYLELEDNGDPDYTTETLAGIIVDKIDRTPKLGDTVDLDIGRLRVEQAAQNRITRIGFYPTGQQESSELAE